jgi:uncharacterized SAM-binding protein YcdF (DUF218 family)
MARGRGRRARQARRGPRLPAALRGSLATLAVGTALWVAGFLWFVTTVPRESPVSLETTEAIVVLTGGQRRLDVGLELLELGLARKLFISGVHRGVDVEQILRLAEQSPDALACCIELGHEAEDTRGNAAETAAWAGAEGIGSLRLVTASYHLPRSMLEFAAAMPTVRIVPHPVLSEGVPIAEWWRRPGTALLLAGEYTKYLFALLRTGL